MQIRMYDEERTIFIESSGVNVLRFKNEDIENRIEWVINKIIKKIEKSSLSPLGLALTEASVGNGKGGRAR